jgi:hypothetical protein
MLRDFEFSGVPATVPGGLEERDDQTNALGSHCARRLLATPALRAAAVVCAALSVETPRTIR